MIKSTWWILYYASNSCLNNHRKLIDLISDDSNNFSFNHMLKIKQHIQLVKFLLLIVFGFFFIVFFVNCALRIILILISNESFVYFIVYWWIYAFEGNVIFNILFNLKNTTFILQQTILSRTTLMFLYRLTNNDYLQQIFDNYRGPSSDT